MGFEPITLRTGSALNHLILRFKQPNLTLTYMASHFPTKAPAREAKKYLQK